MPNQQHMLKSWPDNYNPIMDESRTFEIRLNDRDFQSGDTLHLREWNLEQERYTGREMYLTVHHVSGEVPGLQSGFVAMSIRKVGIGFSAPH